MHNIFYVIRFKSFFCIIKVTAENGLLADIDFCLSREDVRSSRI